VRATDGGSGVDPNSLLIAYRRVLLGAAFYDPASGIALFPIPPQAPTIPAGRTAATGLAWDFQETKNIDQAGQNVTPNTRYLPTRIRGVKGPAVSWLLPEGRSCTTATTRLVVLAGSTRTVREVRFYNGSKHIATTKSGSADIYAVDWKTKGLKKGPHRLAAVVVDAAGKKAAAFRTLRVCR